MAAAEHQIGVNTNLQKQDLNNLDISNLNALSPEVISRQATINIGTIGHVAHGKSTVVKAISGVQTVRFKNELERNITIKLERLREDEIQKLIAIPNYIKTFEERQRKKMEKMKGLNESKKNVLHNSNNATENSVNCFQRGNSCSSSSGYGSTDGGFNEDLKSNSSARFYYIRAKPEILTHSANKRRHSQIERFNRRLSNNQSREDKENNVKKRRKSFSSVPLKTTATTNAATTRRPNKKRLEYVIEDILSIESIDGRPVFFVKWLNYPSEQNTWESLENLNDCLILEHFLEKRYNVLINTINAIMKELDLLIERKNLSLDISTVSMKTLDKFDPYVLKAYLILLAQSRTAKSLNDKEREKIKQKAIDFMLMQAFYEQRLQQLKEMDEFRQRIVKVEPKAPINIENFVDLEVPDLVYINESFPGKNVQILQASPVGCSCAGGQCNASRNCCARMAGSYFAYNNKGRLRILPGEAIYECNNVCSCDATCLNRVIQKGRENSLCLFKTSNGCGWGVRTEKIIHKGEFVCEYVGEIITCEEANERGKLYDAKGRTYLFDLDYNTTQESLYTIDAAMYGNISHFINHSCEPNLAVFPYWINNLDVNMPGLAFFALRRIFAGEELTFDYIRSDLEEKADDNIYENLSDAEKVSCRCGAAKCRKVLF